jgi:hypothetical protein
VISAFFSFSSDDVCHCNGPDHHFWLRSFLRASDSELESGEEIWSTFAAGRSEATESSRLANAALPEARFGFPNFCVYGEMNEFSHSLSFSNSLRNGELTEFDFFFSLL